MSASGGEPSGLSWLGGKTWGQVTREERHFCAELFYAIRQDDGRFVRLLNSKAGRPIPETNWEPAYEICFYRDIGKPEFSQKRTFDLALFSDDAIILIEAKAHQGFDGDQLKRLDLDRKNVAECTGVSEEMIFLVGIISSKYNPRPKTQEHFDLMTTWRDLASCYADNDRVKRICCRADEIYRESAPTKS